MSFDVNRVISVAKAEVGYLEKKTGNLKYLYDKTANAGSANYTKYNYEMHQIYPSVMDYPAAWCDAFVDWCFRTAYGVDNGRKLVGGQYDDYTVASAQLYKNKKAWYAVPKVGDQVFFQNSSRICHTGLVVAVDADTETIWTIEGNTSGASGVVANGGGVCRKSYKMNNSRIAGYGRPGYGAEEIQVTEGWRRAADGVRWWYEYADRSYATGWKALSSSSGRHWYYFDADGYLLTGWQQIGDEKYYLEEQEGPDQGACYNATNGAQRVWVL